MSPKGNNIKDDGSGLIDSVMGVLHYKYQKKKLK